MRLLQRLRDVSCCGIMQSGIISMHRETPLHRLCCLRVGHGGRVCCMGGSGGQTIVVSEFLVAQHDGRACYSAVLTHMSGATENGFFT